MTTEVGWLRSRRTVATRVLLSFAILTAAFAVALGWSVVALRQSAREADLMRSGYLPVARTLRDLVSDQDTWNTQLNHVTDARNPSDKRLWFDTAARVARPRNFAEVRSAIRQAFLLGDSPQGGQVADALLQEVRGVETLAAEDRETVTRLFESLARGDQHTSEDLRDQLVTRGNQAGRRLAALDQRVMRSVDDLLREARARERWAMGLLVGMAAATLLVGLAMAMWARQTLRPLAVVTARAKAVAAGDLSPRSAVASNTEIGELAVTFERMVAAIARANEQLVATERFATIGKMAAHVTHEIRNPLSSIALNVELLEEDIEPGTESATLVRAIKREVERLSELSQQYLSVARQQPLRLQMEDLTELVGDAVAFMRRYLESHRVICRMDVEQGLPEVPADEAQLKQALFNLLRNATEAMPDGGEIHVHLNTEPDSLVVTVDDTGPGIPAEVRTRLFEPFYTTKDHGTGLGLAITFRIIQQHGGTIECLQRSEGGTRFVLRLPLSSDAASGARHQLERQVGDEVGARG
jgi:two-component system NtrC family sensor kinase